MTAKLSIYLHAVDGPELETIDPATVEAVRQALGLGADTLVFASELDAVLRTHRPFWASSLAKMEGPHMVRVVLSGH